MPLQNRVTPDMQIVADSWRGDLMGNRGGRIHDPQTKTLLKRKWASKRWICCVTEFRNRQRIVMGNSYTELFFLDEVCALAAGHRPCFECRHKAARNFADLWISKFGKQGKSVADAMDRVLHEERTSATRKIDAETIVNLPDGAMISTTSTYFAKRNDDFLLWSGNGYRKADLPKGKLFLLTPPSVISVLKLGYQPQWHESA